MTCPECGETTVDGAVPVDLREHAPGDAVAICTDCLTVTAADSGADDPDLKAISDAFPDGEAGVAAALFVGLLDSLALNRASIDALFADLEAHGTDPFLLLDRLASDPGLDPAVDLERRRTQLESTL